MRTNQDGKENEKLAKRMRTAWRMKYELKKSKILN
jgi:hypothetical protein